MKTSYVGNLFCEILGYSPETKIVEYLFEIKSDRFTFNDVVSAINVNRKRAYEILHFFLEEGFIKEVERVKNIQFYRLNIKSPEVKCLHQFFEKVIRS